MGGLFSRRRQHARRPVSEVPFTKDSSILIVGAGPAGIHMAHLLKLKGYTNVKVLEKEKKAGGKAKTLFLEETGDDPHDMGAAYMDMDYDHMRDLAEVYGTPLPIARTGDVSEVIAPELRKKVTPHVDPKKPIGPTQYMLYEEEVERIPKSCWCLPAFIEGPAVLAVVLRFLFFFFCFTFFTFSNSPPPSLKMTPDTTNSTRRSWASMSTACPLL